ncbi:hypothetical protein H0H93_001556 [Arthromyces matolae]|nr:hypothetical protein H0H93_001556 [Arthromyces matolae]
MADPASHLQIAHYACIAALQSIQDPLQTVKDPPELQILRTDFLSLLSFIYATTTKLSLALKPSSPTPSASISPLKDLSEKIAALSHCVRFLGPHYGSTFTREVTSAATMVITSVKSLLQTFLDNDQSKKINSTGKVADEYLVRTGTVHEIIDHTRSTLSNNNVMAVRKVLDLNHVSLDDGLQEIDAIISDQNFSNEASPDALEDNDGWAELGVDSKTPMSPEELARAKKAYTLLRMSTLLHKRIIKDVLTISPGSPSLFIREFDSLPQHSSSLVAASDELIASLYSPQNSSELSADLNAFTQVIDDLRSSLGDLLQEPTLADQMQAMHLQSSSTRTQKDPRRWFHTCFAQIQKTANDLKSILNE